MFKAEAEGRSGPAGGLVHSAGQSLGPGGRKLKTVDSGMNLFGDDDDDGDSKRRREKEFGEEGDLDEQVYEEDFADDEEKMDVDGDDEEAKELEVSCLSLLSFRWSETVYRNVLNGSTKLLTRHGKAISTSQTTKKCPA